MNTSRSKMKLVRWVLVMAVLITGSISYAQGPGGPQGQGGQQGLPSIPNAKKITKMVKALDKELTMSDKQESQVLELYTNHFAKVKKLTSVNARPDRKEMEALKTKMEADVKALLSKEQKTKYLAYLKTEKQSQPLHRR